MVRQHDERPASTIRRPGAYIIVMQRLHEDDLVGHVLEQAKQDGGEEWTVLCLPARYEPDHPFVYRKDPRKKSRRAALARAHGREASPLARSLARPVRRGGPAAAAAGAARRAACSSANGSKIVDARAADLEKSGLGFGGARCRSRQDPDWTAGVKMGRAATAFSGSSTSSASGLAAKVETTIKNTASQDGKRVPRPDPAGSGPGRQGAGAAFVRMLAGYASRPCRRPARRKRARRRWRRRSRPATSSS
jgi:hypothetical protein